MKQTEFKDSRELQGLWQIGNQRAQVTTQLQPLLPHRKHTILPDLILKTDILVFM